MAKAMVICKICGKKFDRNSEPCIKVNGNRYAHKTCAEAAGMSGQEVSVPAKDPDLDALEQYIMQLFGKEYIDARVRKQINEYRDKYNYTYSGMLKSLVYWYDLKGNSIEKANGGIGILPYIYEQACQYYYALFLAQSINEDKNLEEYFSRVREFEIPVPQARAKRIRLFRLEDALDDE